MTVQSILNEEISDTAEKSLTSFASEQTDITFISEHSCLMINFFLWIFEWYDVCPPRE